MDSEPRPTDPHPESRWLPWTARQRVPLALILAAVLAILGIQHLYNPAHVGKTLPLEGPRAAELADRLDPNLADEPALAALPGIGPSLAARIVAEREKFVAENPGRRAYENLDDLKRVKGIGDATVRTLDPHLAFPPSPATRPQGAGF
jgi:DNA uptake protein ComE-like DNA-binding protein